MKTLLTTAFLSLLLPASSGADTLSAASLAKHIYQVDRSRDDRISFDEWVEANRGLLRDEFNRLDRNRDGGITKEELQPRRADVVRRAASRRSADRWERHRFAKEGNAGSEHD